MSSRLIVPGRRALVAALNAAGVTVRAASLEELPRHGLAHRHWRLKGRGLVLRVPILPGSAQTLARQAAIFERAASSGHTPALQATLPPSRDLPSGALLVEAIGGEVPRVPEHLAAIATALAAIHDLSLPRVRAPIPAPAEPFAATLVLIEQNLERGASALPPQASAILEAERRWARGFARDQAKKLRAAPRTLIVTDAHPRNFLIARDARYGRDRAICLDLERGQYASPAIDLAHAILPMAVAWGRAGERLGAADRRRFLDAYFKARGAAASRALRPWLQPFARLVALRTTAAYAAFQASGAERVLEPAARTLARQAIAEALDAERLAKFFSAMQ
jgi:hypothetical protein